MELTVAQAADVISFGVTILQLTCPLLIVLILVGVIRDKANAVTWSVVGRFFNGSYWPTILGTDTATTTNVDRRGVIIPMFSTAALIFLAVAAVITPLGLEDEWVAENPKNAVFTYVHDTSPLGNATPARDTYNISRLCGYWVWLSCPGQNHGFSTFQNSSGVYEHIATNDSCISSVLPANLSEIFSSGRTCNMALVASPFDIQFRTYGTVIEDQSTSILKSNVGDSLPLFHVDRGRPRTVGKFATYESFVLTNDFVVREGIVADMIKGGIGFRNHTLRCDVQKGSRWTGGLLWLEPESVCVANNLSLKTVPPLYFNNDEEMNYLIDNSGLVDLKFDYPKIIMRKGQINPNLWSRAYKAAIMFNANLAMALGVNNTTNTSFMGKEFMVNWGASSSPGIISLGIFEYPPYPLNLDSFSLENNTMLNISLEIQGYGGENKADDGRIGIQTGVVYSSLRSLDDNPNTRLEGGNPFVADVYSCVSAIRAFVMGVTFFINGTSELNNLIVEKSVPRTYQNDMPLWAVEKTNMNVSDVSPLWGLVDDRYETADYLETLRRNFMYIPAGFGSLAIGWLLQSDSLST